MYVAKGLRISTLIYLTILIISLTYVPTVDSSASSDQARATAENLLAQLRSKGKKLGYCSVGEPVPVFSDNGDAIYWMVPAFGNGTVAGIVGVQPDASEWMWYSEEYPANRFPPISSDEAIAKARVFAEQANLRGTPSSPRLTSTHENRLYWKLTVNRQTIYVDSISGETKLELTPKKATDPLCGGGTIYMTHYYQVKSYYCGEATMEMLFEHHGEDISQYEIANVARAAPTYGTFTDDMRRSGHFSDRSTSVGNDAPGHTVTGYTARKLGYATFERTAASSWLNDLKTVIDSYIPVGVLQHYDASHLSGHYRVVVGYDDSLGEAVVHDPWNTAWGGVYGGPNIHFSYATFNDLWSRSGYWGLVTLPWRVDLNWVGVITVGSKFAVKAKITYPRPSVFPSAHSASSCKATISLGAGLTLASGESAAKTIGTSGALSSGSTTYASWYVVANAIGSFSVAVTAEGLVSGSVAAHGSYSAYTYTDRIGGSFATYVRVNSWGRILGKTSASPSKAESEYGGYLPSWLACRGYGSNSIYVTKTMISGDWEPWQKLDGATPSAPSLAASSTKLYLAVRGLNNLLYWRWIGTSGGWSAWSKVPTGSTDATPAIAFFNNRLYMAVKGNGNTGIYVNNMDPSSGLWSGWTKLSGATPSAPALASSSDYLYLAVRGINNRIYWQRMDYLGAWSGWVAIPTGSTDASPSIAVHPSFNWNLYVGVKGYGSTGIYVNQLDLNGYWGSAWLGWTKLGGATTHPPCLYESSWFLVVLVKGTDSNIYCHVFWFLV